MSKARLIITAVVLEGRSQAEVARDYQVSKGWVSRLVARYRAEGDTAFEPRSRRPKTSPTAISPDVVELIVTLRHDLVGQGLDAGPDTIHWFLEHHHATTVSVSTIARTLTRPAVTLSGPGDDGRQDPPSGDTSTGPATGPARCGCGRRMRMAPSVLAQGPVICGLCHEPFATGPRAATRAHTADTHPYERTEPPASLQCSLLGTPT